MLKKGSQTKKTKKPDVTPQKILIICGATATGKTNLALDLCRSINAEIISADSRQVYRGMDIVTGKDIPTSAKFKISKIIWNQRKIGYYETSETKIWLYDVVDPNEEFSVSHWHSIASLLLNNIHNRNKTPLIVGGTGFYIKSLVSDMPRIFTPPNTDLRFKLSKKNSTQLFNQLIKINPSRALSLNLSDKQNPRRLIRAIETSLNFPESSYVMIKNYDFCTIGLRANREYLKEKIDQRVEDRLKQGAKGEVEYLLKKYDPELPSMTAVGYRNFNDPNWVNKWKKSEYHYVKKQLTWFNHQPNIEWFDINTEGWDSAAKKYAIDWYNKQ